MDLVIWSLCWFDKSFEESIIGFVGFFSRFGVELRFFVCRVGVVFVIDVEGCSCVERFVRFSLNFSFGGVERMSVLVCISGFWSWGFWVVFFFVRKVDEK